MSQTFTILIKYFEGRRSGQIICISMIQEEDILDILGEITQDQLKNAEIVIESHDCSLLYEDFIIDFYKKSLNRVKNHVN
jgi:hypothetical protein